MSEEKEIELRTEEVDEILSSPPKWIFRWGATLVLALILVFITLSYFIKYPDVLTAKAVITTLNPPAKLFSKSDGKLVHLYVKDGSFVKKGMNLGVIESTAQYDAVLHLDFILSQINKQDTISLSENNYASLLSYKLDDLGEVTSSYLMFLKAFNEYDLFKKMNFYKREIDLLEKELGSHTSLLEKYKKQEVIQLEEFGLIEKDYNRDESLYKSGTISARDFDNKRKEYLRAVSNLENQKIIITNLYIKITNINKEKLKLQSDYLKQEQQLLEELRKSLKSTLNSIREWKDKYLFQATIEGKVSYANHWAENQNVAVGDAVFNIIPLKKQLLIAKLTLPVQNAGKLQISQQVNIKLDDYPAFEYGFVEGKVKSVSMMSTNNNYLVEVTLPNELYTSYKKKIVYKADLTGTADVITANKSMLSRILVRFREIINK